MPDSALSPENIAAELATLVGDQNVILDEAERRVFSNDIFFWDDSATADIVVKPGTPEEVSAVVSCAGQAGSHISTRGGGMSYTKGYVPAETGCILLDLRRLDRIREVNENEMIAYKAIYHMSTANYFAY